MANITAFAKRAPAGTLPGVREKSSAVMPPVGAFVFIGPGKNRVGIVVGSSGGRALVFELKGSSVPVDPGTLRPTSDSHE